MPLIELELERDGLLEMDLLGNFIGSAYAPQVEVTDTDTGHEVAITYDDAATGITTKRFDVADGEQGPQGPAGYSPTVTITDTPTGHTVTITDAQGPHSYDVPNYAQEEAARQAVWNALSGEVTDAISDAETATSAASTAAQSATSAATSATSAAQAATTAAASANTAASSANAAATAANSAATAAGTAADAATTAAGDATDAASAANTAAQAAQEAATEVAPEVAWLWGNQLTGELTGDILTAADAYAAPPIALTVDGRSTQAGTPTPDAPVPIQSVDGLALNVCGKNLIKETANGYINDAGNVYGTSSRYKHTNYIRVSAGQKYVVTQGGINFPTGLRTAYYDNNKSFINALAMSGVPAFVSTAPSNAAYMRTSCEGNYVSDFMVRVGSDSTVLPYEPYVGTTVPLYDGTLRSLPDGTRDTLALSYLRPSTREGWAWYSRELVQRLGIGTITSFSQFSTLSNGHHRVRHSTQAMAGAANSMSNRFVYNSSTYNYGVPGDYYVSGGYMYCIVPDSLDSLEAVNAWAAENPTVLQYELDPPVTTTLDPIELPVLPAPTCTVWADPTTGLQMEYVRDTSIVIASLQAALADIATS